MDRDQITEMSAWVADPDEQARIHDDDWRAYVWENRDEKIARDFEDMEAEAAR